MSRFTYPRKAHRCSPKAKTPPVTMPGMANGAVTRRKVVKPEAQMLAAARSTERLLPSARR